jgi:hypothetical protein
MSRSIETAEEFNLSIGPFTFHVVREAMEDIVDGEIFHRHTVTSNMVIPGDQQDDVAWAIIARTAETVVAGFADAGLDVQTKQFAAMFKHFLWRANDITSPEVETLKRERDEAAESAQAATFGYFDLLARSISLGPSLVELSKEVADADRIYELYGDAFHTVQLSPLDTGTGFLGPK